MTHRLFSPLLLLAAFAAPLFVVLPGPARGDHLRDLQGRAIQNDRSDAAHWGWDPEQYTLWGTHSNRLIPVYTFGTRDAGEGIDLGHYTGSKSAYRDREALLQLYGRIPRGTLSQSADYLDQTDLFDIQQAALEAGKKYIFLVVFDGMDWQTSRAASIYNLRKVAYEEGRGTGLHFQDYQADGNTQIGFMVTSPHNTGTRTDVDEQSVINPGGELPGGYDPERGGSTPWATPPDIRYLVSRPQEAAHRHAYTDSASSATSMTAGIKTYNNAINVDPTGQQVSTIAHRAQQRGYAVGAVSSVPISHATPAAAYAHNVHRNDYQDLSRDLLGLPSISHPQEPLPGLDVLIGGGHGVIREEHAAQGANFVPGNAYLRKKDLQEVDARNGGPYVVARRTEGTDGQRQLERAAKQAADQGKRLLGFYGVGSARGHLPYKTADGDYQPAPGRSKQAEQYTDADLRENPTLADMTRAALTVLETDPEGFWLMVEPGDVDWANHDNNLDTSIGAVNSGDDAVRVVTEWVDRNSDWQESLLIVTADHGHYLFLDRPEMLIPPDSQHNNR